ncbi:MAG: NAD(+)/NADH kinase [Lachnospiraceae bacterium]|jgi:NAD+ kinase|nr:NAD(+)/NADH kinase [Lachnospiraceae bacterium]MCR5129039.1 NAD(+)/NADH kinase [Lachnospiraceae bacterium]
MKRFCIISNSIKDTRLKVAYRVNACLTTLGAVSKVFDLVENEPVVPQDTEAILVIGGDGTLLSVAKKTMHLKLPMLGINLGAIGYLTEVEISEIEIALKRLIANDFSIEERMMIAGRRLEADGRSAETSYALNDVVISRRGDIQVISYRVYVNNKFLTEQRADGIIVSTPTGSTGYNLSAGGPIVKPDARLLVLTPICPHTLNTRSIILSAEDVVKIELLPTYSQKKVEAGFFIDGASTGVLGPEDIVVVSGTDRVTRIIKLSDDGFLEVLQHKLQ